MAMNSVVVIGGGPAGLMAADVISAAGVAVTVYERMPSVGRKLLMAGRGGLNLTHSEPLERLLGRYGPARVFLEPPIAGLPPDSMIAWTNALGQETFTGSSGRIFPRAMKASPLLRAWLTRLTAQGVKFRLRHRWTGFDVEGRAHFVLGDGTVATAGRAPVVLALGGASWPRLGADGSWAEAVGAMGVDVRPLSAANAGVLIPWSQHFCDRFEGQPLKRIAVSFGNTSIRGEALVTATGLEGGAIYALGPAIREQLEQGGVVRIAIDLRPDDDDQALAERLGRPRGKQSLATWLRKAAHMEPVAISLLRESAGPDLPVDPLALARLIKATSLDVTSLAGLARAISSAGGIALSELGPDMMLMAHPGIFAAGEMLDWEAPTGGYLLQACFSTGHSAGRGVLRHLGRC